MKKKYRISLYLVILLTMVAVMGNVATAATYYTYTNGAPETLANWWTATNGTGTHPANFTTAGDVFTIQHNNTMTSAASWTVTGTVIISNGCLLTNTAVGATVTVGALTINTGGTFTTSRVIIVNGATNITGSINLSGARPNQFNGDVILNSGAVWNDASTTSIAITGSLTNNAATFTASTETYTFSGATKTLSGTTATVIPSATFTGAYTNSGTLTVGTLLTVTGVTLTNNGTITASTALSGTGGITQGTTGVLTIGGTSVITTLTATAVGNTVNYSGAGQTVHSNNYYNLTLSGSGTDVLQTGTTAIGGNLTLSGTVTTTGVVAVTIGGNVVIGSGTTLASGGYTINVAGNWTNNGGTYTPGTGTVNFNGSSVQSINGSAATTFYGLTLNNSNGLTNTTTTTTVSNTLTLTSGTYTLTSGLSMSTGSTITRADGSLSAVPTFAGTVNVQYINTGAISTGPELPAGVAVLTNLTINNTAAVTLSANVQVNGTVTLTAGTLQASTYSITAVGNWTNNGGTFTPGSGTVTFTGNSMAINGTATGQTFNNIIVNKTAGQTLSVGGSTTTLNVNGTYTETTGNFTAPATMSVAGTVTLTAGTFTAGANLTVSGDWINNGGTFTSGAGTVTFNGANQTIGGSTSTTFNNLSTSGSTNTGTGIATIISGNLVIGANTTFTVGANYTLGVTGTTTVTGTYTDNSTGAKTLTGDVTLNIGGVWNETAISVYSFGGNFTNNATAFTASTGTHTFSGAAKTISGSTTTTIANVTFTGAYTNSGTLSVPTLLTVTGVTLTNNATITATTALSGTGGLTQGTTGVLNIGGTSTIATLTAAAVGNIVNYNGAAQTVNVITYYNLTLSGSGIKTFAVTTVNGNLTLSGTATATTGANLTIAGNLIVGDGTIFTADAYNLTVTGTTTVGSGTSGTLIISSTTGTKTFTGLLTVNSGATWNNSANEAITFLGGITNNGTFTAGTGTYTFNTNSQAIGGSSPITFGGVVAITAAITVTNNTNVTITGNLTGAFAGSTWLNAANSTLNAGAAVLTIGTLTATAAGNTVNYTGAGQTLKVTAYYHLTLSGGAETFGAITTVGGNLTLSGTATATTGAALVISGNLIVGDGTTFTAAAFALTVTGTTTVGGGTSGTLAISSATGTKTFTGAATINSGANFTEGAAATLSFGSDLTINSGGTMTESGAAVVGIAGSFSSNGNYTASTGTHTFSGAAKTMSGTASIPTATISGTYSNNGIFTFGTLLTVNGTLTNNSSITATTALSGTGGVTQGTTGVLNIGGTSGITALTATAAGNTVNYTGTGQILKVTAYYNLTLSGGAETFGAITTVGGNLTLSGTATATTGAALVISGNLIVGDGTTFTAAAFALTVTGTATVGGGTSGTLAISSATGAKTFTGDVTINSGAIWNETFAAAITFGGNFTNNATTFTASTGLHTFSGTTKTISGSTTTSIPTVTFTGSYTNSGTLTVATALTVTGAAVVLTNNGTITAATALTGTGGLTQGTTGVLNLGGTSTIATLIATATGNTVNYSGAAQAVFATATYSNLTLSGSGAKTLTTTTTTINGNFTLAGAATTTGVVGLAIGGDVNLGGTTTFTAGTFTYTVYGNWNSNGGTFAAGSSTINYIGDYVGQIVGGGITYYNLQISNGGTKVLTGGTATVSNVLTLNSGVFKLNDNNLILNNTTTSAITGSTYSNSNMIETNGAGYLQKAGAVYSGAIGLNIVYPIGSGGFYNPLDLTSGFTATAGTGTIQLRAVTADQGASALGKYWTLTVTGYGGITTNLRFSYENAEAQGTKSTYDTWYSTGTWVSAPGTHTALGANPFGTNVSSVTAASISGNWSAATTAPGSSVASTFYSYQSGDWADATSWTTDPSGALWINPGVPGSIDNATILNGRTITVNTNGKQVTALTINSGGILNLNSTTGHNFGTVSGQGKIMLSSTTFPGGTYTSFVASNSGTIEYYNLNNTALTTTQFTYNNLTISNYSIYTNSVFLINSANPTTYTINGNFSVKNYSTGSQTVSFGNSTASDNLINMTVYGDFSVDAGCSVMVNNFAGSHAIPNPSDEGATAYPVHTLNLYGNLTNNGSIRFTGLPSPVANTYYTLTTTNVGTNYYGDVQVFFKGATNNTVSCNGTTDFFRLIVEKGTDKTFTLEVSSSSTSNFALYAPNYQGNNAFDGGVINGYGYGAYYKALFIHYGTLKLNENINISSLTEGGQDFNVAPTAGFWINGAIVSTTLTGLNGTGYQAATLYGTIRISAGQFSTGDAAGIVLGVLGTPILMIEGTGTLDVSQVWASSGSNLMSFIQTGGTVNIRGGGEYHAGAMLGLGNAYASFAMSGGTLNFTNVNADSYIMNIQSQVGNYNVIGGTVNINLPSSANASTANSTIPFYNLNITNQSGTGTTTIVWTTSGLIVLHDLTINSNTVLNLQTNSLDLTVGHDFTIASGGTYSPATGTSNVTSFNGTGSQAFNNIGTITGGVFKNFTVTNSSITSIINNNVTVTGTLTIDQNAALNDNGKYIYVTGNIVNAGTHTGLPAGGIIVNGTSAQTINGSGTGSFNNLVIDKSNTTGVSLTGGVAVTGNLRLVTNANFAVGSYKLSLDSAANVYTDYATSRNYDNTHMIVTNGLASDGGVSKKFYSAATSFLYPLGTGTTYRPAQIQFTSDPTQYGSITIKPVASADPLIQTTNTAINFYWKTISSGFTGTGTLNQTYYYYAADVPTGHSSDEINYIPGVYNAPNWTKINDVTQVDETTTPRKIYFTGVNYIDGEYTAGLTTAFGSITTLYSVASGAWSDPNTWASTRTGTGGASGIPTASTLVYICNSDSVWTTASASSVSLAIEAGSTLDVKAITGHSFGTVTNTGTGTGKLRIASSTFPSGDWSNFLSASGGTIEYYQASSGATFTLPAGVTSYYNLIALPYTGLNIILPNSNLTIYNNFSVGTGGGASGGVTEINAGAASTTVEVKGTLTISQYGTLQYMNNAAQYVVADSDITIAAGGALQVYNGNSAVANTLTAYGNIVNNGTFDLDPNYPTNNNYNCALTFAGSASKSLSSTSTPTRTRFYSITVNKGSTMDPIVNVNVDPTNFQMGGGGLTLLNGTFRLTTAASMYIATGSITIPQSTCLSANGGTFYLDTTTTAAGDLNLIGRLEILAGSVNIGPALSTTSTFAYNIVYPAAITPEIIISNGSLRVYSQIRRGTSNNAGSLHYKQSGGTVTIGAKNPSTTRAALEILNTGSKFEMTGGTLIIANHFSTATPYDLYLNSDLENVTGGTIQLGLSGITTSNTFYFLSSGTMGNLTLDAATNSSAIQQTYEVTLAGSLTIGGTSSYYNTNGLDITIAGNLVNNNTGSTSGLTSGGFQPQTATQSTAFNGSTDQTITGTASNLTNFADLEIATTSGHTATLTSAAGKITVNGDLTLTSGTFNDGGNDINVLNNVDNFAVHTSPNATSGGLIFKGTANQGLTGSGSGVFGNIEINNSGNGINMTDNSTVNGQLKFTNGYLYIDNYTITLGQGATIAGTTSATNEIILNGVSSDGGVIKIFPSSSSDYAFTYAIGVNGKSTPCTFDFASNNTSGSIKVIPVDDLHQTIDPSKYSNYLEYYWNVTTSGFTTYSVTHTYNYIASDTNGNPQKIERCDNSTSNWSTVAGTVNSAALKFSFTSTSLLDGSYTIGDAFSGLPTLYSNQSGNWFNSAVWSDSVGNHTIPNGHSVVIQSGHTITLSSNGALASSVVINGVLDAMNTSAHNIGTVTGGGKIRLFGTVSGMFVFPAGTYDSFLATSTSIVEFYGSTNSTMPLSPGNINTPYQHVMFTGTGIKYISSVDIKIKGNLTISAGSKVDNTLYNKDMYVLGNWIDNNTSTAGFTAGTGAVHFSGTAAQTIVMASNSMKETFYNLEINNTAGLTLTTGSVDVSNQLLLTLGNINFASTSNILTLTNSSSSAIIGGSINSFVNGPLSKKISNGSSFQFPVGDTVSSSRKRIGYIVVSNQTTGTQTWTAQFFDQNPTTGGYNVSNVTGLQSVVNNEYWSIIGPSGGNANVTLTWDQYTGQSSVASVRACSRVAEWGTPVSLKWNSVGAVVTDNGQTSGTVATSTAISLDTHYFTIGAVNPSNLITSKGTGNWADASTWDLVRVPGQNDMVHISSGYTVTLNTNTTVAQLIVDNGGTFNNGSGSYTLSLAGNLTLNGSWTGTGTGKISMTTEPGTIFGTGTMTGTSTLEIAGSTNIDTAANLTITNLSILSGKTLTNNGTVTINNLIGADASSTFTNNPGSTLIFNGSDLSTLTLTANQCPNTVVYSGAVSQTVKQTTYCNITISGTGAKTINDGTSITAHGDVIQQSGTPFTVGVITFQIDGGLITGTGFVNNGDITINN